jgi:hypothetical protein
MSQHLAVPLKNVRRTRNGENERRDHGEKPQDPLGHLAKLNARVIKRALLTFSEGRRKKKRAVRSVQVEDLR